MTTILFNPLGPPFDFSNSSGGGGTVNDLIGNDGVTVSPSAGIINVVGLGISSSGVSSAGNIYTTGSGNTLTINETQAQFLTNYRQVILSSNVGPTDYVIGCTSSGITITLPASPTSNRILCIKDESGSAMSTPITIAGNGHNIDGSASITINQNYAAENLYYNGTDWFSY